MSTYLRVVCQNEKELSVFSSCAWLQQSNNVIYVQKRRGPACVTRIKRQESWRY